LFSGEVVPSDKAQAQPSFTECKPYVDAALKGDIPGEPELELVGEPSSSSSSSDPSNDSSQPPEEDSDEDNDDQATVTTNEGKEEESHEEEEEGGAAAHEEEDSSEENEAVEAKGKSKVNTRNRNTLSEP
jgi:hypothetical protein